MSTPSELAAGPPNRRSNTPPPPAEIDFVPDFESKVKYRRSSIVPDYRQSMFAAEPKYSNVPVFAPSYPNSVRDVGYSNNSVRDIGNKPSRRNSDLPAFAQAEKMAPESRRNSRRLTDLSAYASKPAQEPEVPSNRVSDVSGPRPRRSISPESRRGTMSYPAAMPTHGTVSPMTYRSSSPVGFRNGAVSPIGRSSSPITRTRNALNGVSDNGAPLQPQQMQPAQLLKQKAAAQRQMQGLTLNTQVSGTTTPAQAQAQPGSEEDEEEEEVIVMSPAVRAPTMTFRRSRSSLALSAHPSASNQTLGNPTLDSIAENGSGKAYFGQEVNMDDLVAVNLENAFDRL